VTDAEGAALVAVIEQLRAENERLKRALAERDERITRLEHLVEELTRRGKRQAAPFSKGAPKADPKSPGRKSGLLYGAQATRSRPRRIDRRVEVGCPLWCDTAGCRGRVRLANKVRSYVVDLPPIKPVVTEFTNHYGFCEECGRRVWKRGEGQIGDPFSPTKVKMGAGVVAVASYLKTAAGMSFGKISSLFEAACGLKVAPSTICRALQRVARRSEAIHKRLVRRIRGSPVVYGDETGWRIGGQTAWLWTFTNGHAAVYAILRGRGYAEAALVLGADFCGTLGVDGWAPYRSFSDADIQTCLAHLLRRCDEVLALVTKGAVRFPRAVKRLLRSAIQARDRHEAGEITDHGLLVVKGRLEAALDRWLAADLTNHHNVRFARHLRRYRDALFPFLTRPELEATNWPAEQSIRPAVVNRKTCGGNRSDRGAQTLAVLMSVLRTCTLQGRSSIPVFRRLCLGDRITFKLAYSR
jgi:transposase